MLFIRRPIGQNTHAVTCSFVALLATFLASMSMWTGSALAAEESNASSAHSSTESNPSFVAVASERRIPGQPQLLISEDDSLVALCGEASPLPLGLPESMKKMLPKSLAISANGLLFAVAAGNELAWATVPNNNPSAASSVCETREKTKLSWNVIKHPPGERIQAVAILGESCLVAGTPEGLYFVPTLGNSPAESERIPHPLRGVRVFAVQSTAMGKSTLLIGTRDYGLFAMTNTGNGCPTQAKPQPLILMANGTESETVRSVSALSWYGNRLLLGTRNGALFEGTLDPTLRALPTKLEVTKRWHAILPSKILPLDRIVQTEKDFYLSRGTQLIELNPQGDEEKRWGQEEGLPEGGTYTTWVDDANQALWVGTERFPPRVFGESLIWTVLGLTVVVVVGVWSAPLLRRRMNRKLTS